MPSDTFTVTYQRGLRGSAALRVGFLRGLILLSGNGDVYVDSSFVNDGCISRALTSSAVRKIQGSLFPLVRGDDRLSYIENFIDEVELRNMRERRKNSGVKLLYDAVRDFERRHYITHPDGLGILAVHLYHETRREQRPYL